MSRARYISLVPSITESLVAFGHPPIACTRFCKQAGIETVGGTKDPNLSRIIDLEPDLVFIDTEENRKEDFEGLIGASLKVEITQVTSVESAAQATRRIAALCGKEIPATVPTQKTSQAGFRHRCAVIIWRNPTMLLGHETYGADLLRELGLEVAESEQRYPDPRPQEVAQLDIDLWVVPSEPYPFGERHRRKLEAIAPVFFVDGEDLFWWGSRTEGAIQRLRASLEKFLLKDESKKTLSQQLNDRACHDQSDGYRDPTSGLWVFSSLALAARPCCGNGCRHCPYL